MIEMQKVSKWYGEFQVLKNCTTRVDKGEVVAIGKHADLMENEPIYAEIYNSQILSYEEEHHTSQAPEFSGVSPVIQGGAK